MGEAAGQAEAARVPAPINIQSRVSRYSYGFWDGTGDKTTVSWFIKKVRRSTGIIPPSRFHPALPPPNFPGPDSHPFIARISPPCRPPYQ